MFPKDVAEPPILIYGQYFQYSNRHVEHGPNNETIPLPEPGIDMFTVVRHFRSGQMRMGDVMRLRNVRRLVQLVPKFGRYANPELTKDNSAEICTEYYINNFDDKETFHAILSYQ
jgi:hypothetical protein